MSPRRALRPRCPLGPPNGGPPKWCANSRGASRARDDGASVSRHKSENYFRASIKSFLRASQCLYHDISLCIPCQALPCARSSPRYVPSRSEGLTRSGVETDRASARARNRIAASLADLGDRTIRSLLRLLSARAVRARQRPLSARHRLRAKGLPPLPTAHDYWRCARGAARVGSSRAPRGARGLARRRDRTRPSSSDRARTTPRGRTRPDDRGYNAPALDRDRRMGAR